MPNAFGRLVNWCYHVRDRCGKSIAFAVERAQIVVCAHYLLWSARLHVYLCVSNHSTVATQQNMIINQLG